MRQKKNILTLVLFEKKIRNETKNHNPPTLQVKWSVPNVFKRCMHKYYFMALDVHSCVLYSDQWYWDQTIG